MKVLKKIVTKCELQNKIIVFPVILEKLKELTDYAREGYIGIIRNTDFERLPALHILYAKYFQKRDGYIYELIPTREVFKILSAGEIAEILEISTLISNKIGIAVNSRGN